MTADNQPKLSLRLKADLLLLVVTILWGSAFAVMRLATGHGTIFFLNGFRFMLGAILLLPIIKLKGAFNRSNIVYVCLAGFVLYGGTALQQAGLATTTAGNAGFITSLYVVIVPFILWIFWREQPSRLTSVAVLMAVLGGFLLSTAGSFRVRLGDVIILISSFLWAMHVVIIGKAQGNIEALPLAFGQFVVCGLLNLVSGVILEQPGKDNLIAVLPAIIYTGIFSIAIGFTLQVVAQKHTPMNDAALIMSLESVFAVLFGWLILGEKLLPIQTIGCVLILLAVILVQVRNGKMRAL